METRESIATGMANSALQGSSVQLNDGLTRVLNALDELAGKMCDASTKFGVHDEDAANEIRAAAAATENSTVIKVLRG